MIIINGLISGVTSLLLFYVGEKLRIQKIILEKESISRADICNLLYSKNIFSPTKQACMIISITIVVAILIHYEALVIMSFISLAASILSILGTVKTMKNDSTIAERFIKMK